MPSSAASTASSSSPEPRLQRSSRRGRGGRSTGLSYGGGGGEETRFSPPPPLRQAQTLPIPVSGSSTASAHALQPPLSPPPGTGRGAPTAGGLPAEAATHAFQPLPSFADHYASQQQVAAAAAAAAVAAAEYREHGGIALQAAAGGGSYGAPGFGARALYSAGGGFNAAPAAQSPSPAATPPGFYGAQHAALRGGGYGGGAGGAFTPPSAPPARQDSPSLPLPEAARLLGSALAGPLLGLALDDGDEPPAPSSPLLRRGRATAWGEPAAVPSGSPLFGTTGDANTRLRADVWASAGGAATWLRPPTAAHAPLAALF